MNEIQFGAYLTAVRERRPLVQCITNFITANDCANIILAAGGYPTMAHHIGEAAEIAAACHALVLNLGSATDSEAMLLAAKRANELGRPVVLDPVAAGVSALRRRISAQLLEEVQFAVIRGNASEIRYLAQGSSAARGVDAAEGDLVCEENLPQALALADSLAKRTGAVVVLSGPIDLIVSPGQAGILRNGCATMPRITGCGCMLTALTGAFCGASPDAPFAAAVAAAAAMGICGEIADEKRLKNGTGTATFRTNLIDAMSDLTEQQLNGGIQYVQCN